MILAAPPQKPRHRAEGLCEDPSPALPQRLGVLGLCCVFTCDEALWSQLFKTRADYIGVQRVPLESSFVLGFLASSLHTLHSAGFVIWLPRAAQARTPEYFHRMAAIMTDHEVRVSPVLWSLLTSFALVEGAESLCRVPSGTLLNPGPSSRV